MTVVAVVSPISTVTPAPLDEAGLCTRVFEAAPGERIEYHRGFLALDRMQQGRHADRQMHGAVARTADRAFVLAEKGAVHLVQKRLAPECFSYLAVVRPRQRRAARHLADLPVEEPA